MLFNVFGIIPSGWITRKKRRYSQKVWHKFPCNGIEPDICRYLEKNFLQQNSLRRYPKQIRIYVYRMSSRGNNLTYFYFSSSLHLDLGVEDDIVRGKWD